MAGNENNENILNKIFGGAQTIFSDNPLAQYAAAAGLGRLLGFRKNPLALTPIIQAMQQQNLQREQEERLREQAEAQQQISRRQAAAYEQQAQTQAEQAKTSRYTARNTMQQQVVDLIANSRVDPERAKEAARKRMQASPFDYTPEEIESTIQQGEQQRTLIEVPQAVPLGADEMGEPIAGPPETTTTYRTPEEVEAEQLRGLQRLNLELGIASKMQQEPEYKGISPEAITNREKYVVENAGLLGASGWSKEDTSHFVATGETPKRSGTIDKVLEAVTLQLRQQQLAQAQEPESAQIDPRLSTIRSRMRLQENKLRTAEQNATAVQELWGSINTTAAREKVSKAQQDVTSVKTTVDSLQQEAARIEMATAYAAAALRPQSDTGRPKSMLEVREAMRSHPKFGKDPEFIAEVLRQYRRLYGGGFGELMSQETQEY